MPASRARRGHSSPPIDRGDLDGVTLGALVKACAAVGADVDVRLRWRGEQLDRLLDQEHAITVETIVRRLARAGWTVEVEVSFAVWGERGSIDVLAFHPARGALLVVEVKSTVPDAQATIHGLDRKRRLAPGICEGRGWAVRHTSRLLVIASSATARRRVAALEATLGIAFPSRGAAVRSFVADPIRPISGLALSQLTARPAFGGDRRAGSVFERLAGLE